MDLDELFREDSEMEGLLEAYEAAYGAPDERAAGSAGARKPRERLLEIVDELGDARVVALLIGFAQGFACMAQEICDLCAESGIGIDGQIRFATDHVRLKLSPLDAGWVYGGTATWTPKLAQRADALAAELDEMTRALSAEKLLHKVNIRESYSGDLGDLGPLRGIIDDIFSDDRTHKFFAEADVRTVRVLHGQIADISGRLSNVLLGPALSSAVAELEQRVRDMQGEMEDYKTDKKRPNRALATIAADFEATASAVARLAQRATEGRRAEAGLADFLRTDFWPYRWRVYELWLLVRVLRLLQANGGRIALLGVEDSVWTLHYSRSDAPVASCEIRSRRLDIYYQLYEKARTKAEAFAQKADMPDIAIKRRDGAYLFILDPKHGRTYSRPRVKHTLDRYLRLGADVTAIVNYMDMSAYQFELIPTDAGIAVLASGVAPQGRGITPLEELLAGSLRAAGYAQEPQLHEVIPMAPNRKPAQSARLVYWAESAREVDEPAGLWMVEEDGGPIPFHGPAGDVDKVKLEAVHVSADGSACAIATENCILILSDAQGRSTLLPKPQNYKRAAWSPDRRKFAMCGYGSVIVLGEDGREMGNIPVENIQDVCWLDDQRLIGAASQYRGSSSALRIALPDRCETVREWKQGYGSSSCLMRLDPENVLIGELGNFNCRIESGGSCVDIEWGSGLREIRSVSPSTRYRVLDGPQSLRTSAGVMLLTIKDMADQPVEHPLVRFVTKHVLAIEWSSDETQAAFLARGEDGSARLMSFRLGDRHAGTVSMPGQEPTHFAWLKPSFVTQIGNNWSRLAVPSPA
jgi:hypothetical protein